MDASFSTVNIPPRSLSGSSICQSSAEVKLLTAIGYCIFNPSPLSTERRLPRCPAPSSSRPSVMDKGLCPMRSAGWFKRSLRGRRLAPPVQNPRSAGALGPVVRGGRCRAAAFASDLEPGPAVPCLCASLEMRPYPESPAAIGWASWRSAPPGADFQFSSEAGPAPEHHARSSV